MPITLGRTWEATNLKMQELSMRKHFPFKQLWVHYYLSTMHLHGDLTLVTRTYNCDPDTCDPDPDTFDPFLVTKTLVTQTVVTKALVTQTLVTQTLVTKTLVTRTLVTWTLATRTLATIPWWPYLDIQSNIFIKINMGHLLIKILQTLLNIKWNWRMWLCPRAVGVLIWVLVYAEAHYFCNL